MRRLVQMLKKLSQNCHDFILHCRQSPAITREDKESCFDIFLRITTFLAEVVHFFRQGDDFSELIYPTGTTPISEDPRNHYRELILARQVTTNAYGLN